MQLNHANRPDRALGCLAAVMVCLIGLALLGAGGISRTAVAESGMTAVGDASLPRVTSHTLFLPAVVQNTNLLVNGGFEEPWTDLPPAGSLTNQQPAGWTLVWLEPGTPLWDAPGDIARGVPECLHKPQHTLPPDEWLGAEDALILDGRTTYKMFHSGTSFGSQLTQTVTLGPGSYRLTVPVQLHWQENLDPDDPTWDTLTAESGAWIVADGQTLGGGWRNAREMGDREWTSHVVEFELTETADVEVLLRFKSKYANKDFFVDAVSLVRVE